MKRRTEGFAEKWQQILCMGNELDTALRWTDFGINFDCSAVSVVLRNIAAEGLSNLSRQLQQICQKKVFSFEITS